MDRKVTHGDASAALDALCKFAAKAPDSEPAFYASQALRNYLDQQRAAEVRAEPRPWTLYDSDVWCLPLGMLTMRTAAGINFGADNNLRTWCGSPEIKPEDMSERNAWVCVTNDGFPVPPARTFAQYLASLGHEPPQADPPVSSADPDRLSEYYGTAGNPTTMPGNEAPQPEPRAKIGTLCYTKIGGVDCAVLVADGVMTVKGDGFGPDKFLLWRGPANTPLGRLTKGNAAQYLDKSGEAYGPEFDALWSKMVYDQCFGDLPESMRPVPNPAPEAPIQTKKPDGIQTSARDASPDVSPGRMAPDDLRHATRAVCIALLGVVTAICMEMRHDYSWTSIVSVLAIAGCVGVEIWRVGK